jgi:hypothetical protein
VYSAIATEHWGCEAIIHKEYQAFSQETFCCSRHMQSQREENVPLCKMVVVARVKRSSHCKPQHGSWAFNRNFVWGCHYSYGKWGTEFSLLCRGKSTAAPPTASPQCTCDWCGVENFGVIVPYFFEDEDGRAVTVTSARYVEMWRNFLTPELSRRGTELSAVWF